MTMFKATNFRASCIAGLFLMLCSALSGAQEAYPARPIHFVVPFSPGTAVDGIARVIGAFLAKDLNTSVVVENREGASGMVGASLVAGAKPDGYTVLMGTQAIVTAVFLTPTMPFDPTKDLAPVVKVGSAPLLIFAARDSRLTSFAALVADAKANPGAQTYATAGPGSSGHLGTEVIKKAFGFQARDVGYKSQPQAMIDTVAGRVSFAMANIPVARAQLDAGTLRALAVGSRTRMAALPDTPTFAELMGKPDFELGVWYGLLVPGGTPQPVTGRLRGGIVKAMSDPAIRLQVERALGGGSAEIEDTPAFQARIRDEMDMYRKLIMELGLTPKS